MCDTYESFLRVAITIWSFSFEQNYFTHSLYEASLAVDRAVHLTRVFQPSFSALPLRLPTFH